MKFLNLHIFLSFYIFFPLVIAGFQSGKHLVTKTESTPKEASSKATGILLQAVWSCNGSYQRGLELQSSDGSTGKHVTELQLQFRRKSARHLCEMLLPKICLNWFSSSVGNYQIKLFKNENWKNSSLREKKVSLGAWCPLPRNLWSISYNVGTVIWLYYKTDWKNAWIGLTSTSSQRWLQKPSSQHEPSLATSRGLYLWKGSKTRQNRCSHHLHFRWILNPSIWHCVKFPFFPSSLGSTVRVWDRVRQ